MGLGLGETSGIDRRRQGRGVSVDDVRGATCGPGGQEYPVTVVTGRHDDVWMAGDGTEEWEVVGCAGAGPCRDLAEFGLPDRRQDLRRVLEELEHCTGRGARKGILPATGAEYESAVGSWDEVDRASGHEGSDRTAEQMVLPGKEEGPGYVKTQDVPVDRAQGEIEIPMGTVDPRGTEARGHDDPVRSDPVERADGARDHRYSVPAQDPEGRRGESARIHLVVPCDADPTGDVPGE